MSNSKSNWGFMSWLGDLYHKIDDMLLFLVDDTMTQNSVSNVRKHVQTVSENNDMKLLDIALQNFPLFDDRRRYGLCENAFENAIHKTVEENTQFEKQYIGDFSHLSESAQDIVKNTLKNYPVEYYPVEYVEDMEWEIINIDEKELFD